MIEGSLTIEWAGESLVLLRERAVWWPEARTLLIADPHFGKAATFRWAGIPVPEATHDDDLERLSVLLAGTEAQRLVILGDFFHAKMGKSAATLAVLTAWRTRHAALEIVLVLGNHDRSSGTLPAEWGFACVQGPWTAGPFRCHHEPREEKGAFVFAGHLHPSFGWSGRTGSGVRAPCFHFGAQLAVLPAFGSFTGTHTVQANSGERIFLVGPDAVAEVSRPRKARGKNRQPGSL
jgi:DNA ligase-associated metallophosphoesterase